MKKIQYVKLVGLLTILLFLNISCKDDDTLLRGSGITEQSWSTNQTYFASAEQTLTFTFTTLSSWTAQNSSTALLSLDNTAGNSGENTIKVTVHKSSQEQGTITIKVNGYSSASNIKIQLSDDDVQGYEINYSVDQYLREKYLWNDDYKLLTPNFRQAYDEFLRNTLLSMTTNKDVKFLMAVNEEIIGLVFLIEKENEALIYYFAINDVVRSKGYGSIVLTKLKEKYQNLIIIMEKVNKESIDYELQEKRLKFYQKNDFKLTDYLLSDYSGEFELLSLNDKINVNIVESMLSVIDNGNFNFKVLKK